MLKKRIKTFVKPIKRKMTLERMIDRVLLMILVFSIGSVIVAVASHLIVLLYIERWLIGGVILSVLVGIILGLIKHPRMSEVLKATDHLGYDERLMTAWALAEDESTQAQLQRKDMYSVIDTVDVRKHYKVKWQPKKLLIALVLLCACVGLLMINSTKRTMANETEATIEDILAEEKVLKASVEELLEEKDAPEAIKKEMEEVLKALQDKLKDSGTEEEALKALSIAKDEIKKLDMKELEKDLSKLKEQMKAMEEQPKDSMGQEDLKNQIDQAKEALEALEEMGIELEDMKDLEGMLGELEKAMASEDEAALEEAMASLSDAMEAMEDTLASTGELSNSMQGAINEAGKSLSSNPTVSDLAFSTTSQSTQSSATTATQGSNGEMSQSEGGQEGQSGENQGQSGENGADGQQGQGGSNSGAGNQSGSSGQSSVASGQSSGEALQGQGTTNEDQGYSGETQSTTGQWFQGEEKSETYEALYTPNRIGGESDPSFVQGNKGEGGETQVQQVEGAPTMTGDMVNYREMYAEYSNEAMHSVDDMEIPVLMKDLVKAYFTSLE